MEIITDLSKLEVCETVDVIDDREEAQKIMDDLTEVMQENTQILALSAPQIGINKNVFCIRFEDKLKFFLNPVLNKRTKFVIEPETCASLPGKEVLIRRPTEVTAVYMNENFKIEDNKFLGMAAKLFQQQVDFIRGHRLDIMGLVNDVSQNGSFADLTDDEFREIVEFYVNTYCAELNSEYKKLFSADDDLATQYRVAAFTENVMEGVTLLVRDEVEDEPTGNREQRRQAVKNQKIINRAVRKRKEGTKNDRRKN